MAKKFVYVISFCIMTQENIIQVNNRNMNIQQSHGSGDINSLRIKSDSPINLLILI